jgi:hypothetical protein
MGLRRIGLVCLLVMVCGCATHLVHQTDGMIHLAIRNPTADSVKFACSRDGYQLHPATPKSLFRWEAQVDDTTEAFKYFFLVDGRVYLPACRFKEYDDFGSQICIYVPGM